MLIWFLCTAIVGQAPPEVITPTELEQALESPPEGQAATRLAVRIRASLPEGGNLERGVHLIEADKVAFIVEPPAESGPPRLDGMVARQQPRTMSPIGDSGLFATVLTVPPDAKFSYDIRAGRERIGGATVEMPGWSYPAESSEVADRKYGAYKPLKFRSRTFNNERTGWIYVPAAYDGSEPAALMIFQDGDAYKDERVGTVVDNLIAEEAMPVTILALLNPGVSDEGRPNRSVEYDTLSDAYATFLVDEVIPMIGRDYRLIDDPASRAIGGASSGGICAFTAAWERPDVFGRVCSHIGSFTNIRGGGAYPEKVRQAPRKPIVRVVLQDGENDLINRFGDWWQANQAMRDALAEKGYAVEFVADQGYHAFFSAGRALPETLRLTWAGWDGKSRP